MSDERFDRALVQVLREVAGEEAPMSLRFRLANVTEQAPISRRLWFAPPMRLSVAAVAAVAVIALAILLVPAAPIGPAPTTSLEPTKSVEPSVTPGEPTPSVGPTATPLPIPEPTPVVTEWTGLTWRPMAPQNPEGISFGWIHDILPWDEGYVAVGTVQHDDGTAELAFFASTDAGWTVVQQVASQAGQPVGDGTRLVATADGLLAVRVTTDPVADLWASTDGVTWREIDSASWTDAWADADFVGIASGSHGIVAIGQQRNRPFDVAVPVVLHSADGRTWTPSALSGGSSGVAVHDVTLGPHGFVLVGGRALTGGEQIAGGSNLEVVAWTSSDGASWEPAATVGARYGWFRRVIAGEGGLFAESVFRASAPEGPVESSSGWVSTDGRSWEWIGQMGVDAQATDLPAATVFAGDGTRMVMLAHDPDDSTMLAVYVSSDGLAWTRLAVLGGVAPTYAPEGSVGAPSPSAAWVTPEGVFVASAGGAPAQGMSLGVASGR